MTAIKLFSVVTTSATLAFGLLFPVSAQVIPDGTTSTTVDVDGTINNGDRAGRNLFHSFSEFSVPNGGQAFFNNSVDIVNIFSRVTGGNLSSIDGLLRANGTANLFLLNPAGIIFGENASLDIGGSFFGSTADSIIFPDGEFSALDADNPPLITINAPLGLGIRDNPADIINESVSDNLGLQVAAGETISLTGGTVSFDGGKATAPGGKVEVLGNIVSLINNSSIDVSSETGGGIVLIGGEYQGGDALITASRTYIDDTVTINADALTNGNGGRVIVWADEVTGFYGNISARGGSVSGNGGFIEVSGQEHLLFHGNVDTSAVNGFTGTLLLDPTNIIIANGSGDEAGDGTDTFAGNNSGVAGSILSAPLSEIDDSAPTTIYETELEGLSGDTNIILQATNDITLEDLADDELNFAAGNGVIAFTADADRNGVGDFVMEDTSVVIDIDFFGRFNTTNDADTINTNGRNIAISGANLTLGNINTFIDPDTVGETIETAQVINSVSGGSLESILGSISEPGDVDTYQIFLTGDGTFSATTLEGTDVDTRLFLFDAAGFGVYANTFQADCNCSQSTLPAGTPLTPTLPGIYYLSVSDSGVDAISDLGNIFPSPADPEVSDLTAALESVSSPIGEGGTQPLRGFNNEFGSVGNYTINLTGVERAEATFVEPIATGDSGSINLNANNGNINIGGRIDSSSYEIGNAGDININASDTIFSISSIEIQRNGIFSEVNGDVGNAGEINISTGSLIFTNLYSIANSVGGVGDPSGIFITARDTISLDNAAAIRNWTGEDAVGSSEGINITTDTLLLNNGAQITAPTFGQVDGGNVNITALTEFSFNGFDPLSPGNISSIFTIVNDPETEGDGGNINITTEIFSLSNNARLTSGTNGIGNGGDININATNVSLTNGASIASDSARTAQGDGGDIIINATGAVSLEGGSIFFDGEEFPQISSISSSTSGRGNAGNITVNAESIVLDNAAISAEIEFSFNSVDTQLFLFDPQGNLLDDNDDSGLANLDAGSDSGLDSLLQFTFTEDGTYTIGVSAFSSSGDQGGITGNRIAAGENYTLQVSVENQLTSLGADSLITKIEPNNSLDTAQNINNSFSLNENPNIPDSTSIPHVSITAEGDGTFDYYSFDATANSLGIFDIDGTFISNTTVQAGNINLNATGDITISENSSINNSTSSQGNAGDINITANSLFLSSNADLTSSTLGVGDAGNITIDVTDATNLSNNAFIFSRVEGVGIGDGGQVTINTNSLSLTEGSEILADTFGQGDGGNIFVTANDSITISGVAPFPILEDGRAGGFSSGLLAGTEAGAEGQGGSIIVNTPQLTLSDGGVIAVRSQSDFTGGNIIVNANNLEITGGGQIQAAAFSNGAAGNINLNINNQITIDGNDPTFQNRFDLLEATFGRDQANFTIDPVSAESGVFANTILGSNGDGGNITIGIFDEAGNFNPSQFTTEINLSNQGTITADSEGTGSGGIVTIHGEDINLDAGEISARTANRQEGANQSLSSISLLVDNNLVLRNNSEISAEATNSADGGNITIDAGFIIGFPSRGAGNDIRANAAENGVGGRIDITTQGVLGLEERSDTVGLLNNTNDIDASSEFGLNGDVNINNPDINPLQGVNRLPTNPISADTIATDACSATGGETNLIIKGKGGITPEPTTPLPAESLIPDGQPITLEQAPDFTSLLESKIEQEPENPNYIPAYIKPVKTDHGDLYPARGVIVQEDGTVILTAYPNENKNNRVPQTVANCNS